MTNNSKILQVFTGFLGFNGRIEQNNEFFFALYLNFQYKYSFLMDFSGYNVQINVFMQNNEDFIGFGVQYFLLSLNNLVFWSTK